MLFLMPGMLSLDALRAKSGIQRSPQQHPLFPWEASTPSPRWVTLSQS
jgi:hypothetical protein